jgi:hypothetical protein
MGSGKVVNIVLVAVALVSAAEQHSSLKFGYCDCRFGGCALGLLVLQHFRLVTLSSSMTPNLVGTEHVCELCGVSIATARNLVHLASTIGVAALVIADLLNFSSLRWRVLKS